MPPNFFDVIISTEELVSNWVLKHGTFYIAVKEETGRETDVEDPPSPRYFQMAISHTQSDKPTRCYCRVWLREKITENMLLLSSMYNQLYGNGDDNASPTPAFSPVIPIISTRNKKQWIMQAFVVRNELYPLETTHTAMNHISQEELDMLLEFDVNDDMKPKDDEGVGVADTITSITPITTERVDDTRAPIPEILQNNFC